jgi:hypothetical protein
MLLIKPWSFSGSPSVFARIRKWAFRTRLSSVLLPVCHVLRHFRRGGGAHWPFIHFIHRQIPWLFIHLNCKAGTCALSTTLVHLQIESLMLWFVAIVGCVCLASGLLKFHSPRILSEHTERDDDFFSRSPHLTSSRRSWLEFIALHATAPRTLLDPHRVSWPLHWSGFFVHLGCSLSRRQLTSILLTAK